MTNTDKLDLKLYENFHESSRIQKRVIGKYNFTYISILRWIENYISSNKNLTILDYGCGVGTLSMYLASRGHKSVGIDISPKAIAAAKLSARNLNLKNCEFYLNGKRKFGKKFDAALCIEVIEHVPNPDKTLSELHALLKNDGYLFLSTPSQNAPLYRAGLLKSFDKRVGHLRRYSKDELVSILEKNKFKVSSIEEKEGILRNILYTSDYFGWIIRFIRGPISVLVTEVDNVLINIFGESNYFVTAQKL